MSEIRKPIEISLDRIDALRYEATNARGGKVRIGSGDDGDFTPSELLLAAISGCSSIDVDIATHRRAEPDEFSSKVAAEVVKDSSGNRLENIEVTFKISFPEGEGGDRARRILDRSIKDSHDRLCTVGRTVEIGTPIILYRPE